MFRYVATLLAVAASIAVSSTNVLADHHEADEVKKAVRQFYRLMSAGEYEQALSHIQLGGKGYVGQGLLATMASDEVRQMVVKDMEEDADDGLELRLRPEYIDVAVHGQIAIATYLIDAMITVPNEDEPVREVNRGSLVWKRTDDGWRIVHWHISKLTMDDDD